METVTLSVVVIDDVLLAVKLVVLVQAVVQVLHHKYTCINKTIKKARIVPGLFCGLRILQQTSFTAKETCTRVAGEHGIEIEFLPGLSNSRRITSNEEEGRCLKKRFTRVTLITAFAI